MKILLLNYEFPPMGGGAGYASYHLANELVKMGHSVDILTSRFGDQLAEETMNGIKVYRVNSWRNSIHDCGLLGAFTYVLFAFFRLRRLLKTNRYEILHYFFSLPTGFLSLYTHGIRNFPYVVSLRGSDVPEYDTSGLKLRLLHRLLRPLTKMIWRCSKRVVSNSHGLRDLALRTAPNQIINVVYNGVDGKIFKPNHNRATSIHNGMRLLCVSRLIQRKGLEFLFHAVAEIKDRKIHLDIVGTGNHEQMLRKKVEQLGIKDKVRFHGYQPHKELSKLYNNADILILPTFSESASMVVLEAMSCGLPIIASNVGGIPEVITEGENGKLVPSGNIKEITQAIIYLFDNPSLRFKFSQNNIVKVREEFTWEKIAFKYQKIYLDALE